MLGSPSHLLLIRWRAGCNTCCSSMMMMRFVVVVVRAGADHSCCKSAGYCCNRIADGRCCCSRNCCCCFAARNSPNYSCCRRSNPIAAASHTDSHCKTVASAEPVVPLSYSLSRTILHPRTQVIDVTFFESHSSHRSRPYRTHHL